MKATFSKLKDGSWGIRTLGFVSDVGQHVTVTKADETKQDVIVTHVLWSGKDSKTGEPASLCKIQNQNRNKYQNHSRRKQCVSGGNCSSFGNGKNCGGEDCDGY